MYRITIDEAVYITVSFFFPDVHKYAFSDGSMNFRTGGHSINLEVLRLL